MAKKKKQRINGGEVIWVIRRIIKENFHEYKGSYALTIMFLLAIAGSTAYLGWIMRDVINQIFFLNRKDLIIILSFSIFVAFVVRGVSTYGQAVLLAKIGNNIVARYQAKIFKHLTTLDMNFFAKNRSGQLSAQINQNLMGVRDILNIVLTSIARDAVTLVALIGVMFAADPYLSLIVFVIGPPLGFVINHLMRKLRKITRQSVDVNSRLLGAMQEAVQGIAIVKAFTMEKQLGERMKGMIDWSENRANKIARVSERTTPIAEIIAGAAVASAIAFTSYQALDNGQLPGAMVAFVTSMLLAYDPARRLARAQVGLERALVNARMIFEILDTPSKQEEGKDAKALQVSKGTITFDQVSFGYSDEMPVLNAINFEIEAGTTTAIVGASGAGKSTLIALLLRFYDPTTGKITIDGQDISNVTKSSLRESIAYVSQHPYLFEGTIRDNIRYGREDASDNEIVEAAKLANGDNFIRAQELGYETPVGESGASLSGGQRQRLSIARAIVRKAPILLLDEATSALDNKSEKYVQQALETIMRGCTTIVIAHRLSTIVNADKIVVMDNGNIVETGRHEELLKQENGHYRHFYELHINDSAGEITPDDMLKNVDKNTSNVGENSL